MSTTNYPEFWTGRACVGEDQDLFFPTQAQTGAARRAQALCAACPVLAQCAEWAAPLVERKDLVECVVAGVRVPRRAANFQIFAALAQELAEVALLGHLTESAEAA
ncbi:WhiB family transcriptional regulator [Nocardia grenadensis]